jgi:hypothetical protein
VYLLSQSYEENRLYDATQHHKYRMKHPFVLNFYQYKAMIVEGGGSESSLAFWEDCVLQVEKQILQDCTTTKENLRDKIKSYVLNYLAITPELSAIEKDTLIENITDEIENDFKNVSFDQRIPATVLARQERDKIPEAPENKYIKLSL